MLDASHTSYINTTPRANMDRETLTALANLCSNGKRTVILGFNDYAKHLINMFGDQIVCVLDFKYAGISFRDVEVREPEWCETAQFLVCDYRNMFIYKKLLYKQCHKLRVPFLFARTYEKSKTVLIDFPVQEPIYQQVFNDTPRPATMLSQKALFFLLEMLKSVEKVEGEVVEIGAWQGGAAWHMARLLEILGSKKELHTFEMGEELKRDNGQGIICHDQMRSDLSFYPHTYCHFGPAITSMRKYLSDKSLSFVFLDFGYSEAILNFAWEHMSIGAVLLLDNYAHTLGHPDLFDDFLSERDATAVRLYKDATAFAIKRTN